MQTGPKIFSVSRTPQPTTKAGRAKKSEEHQARRQAMREKLWSKLDYILDLIEVGCRKDCEVEHQHAKGSTPRDIKELTIAFGVLLDKYRLETGGGAGDGSDIDDYLLWLGSESRPPEKVRSRQIKKAEKVVANKVH